MERSPSSLLPLLLKYAVGIQMLSPWKVASRKGLSCPPATPERRPITTPPPPPPSPPTESAPPPPAPAGLWIRRRSNHVWVTRASTADGYIGEESKLFFCLTYPPPSRSKTQPRGYSSFSQDCPLFPSSLRFLLPHRRRRANNGDTTYCPRK